MSNEWKDLLSMYEVADAQADGWEIQVYAGAGLWLPWDGEFWLCRNKYQGRPKQPKKITVTSECWRSEENGRLEYTFPNCSPQYHGSWQRFHAGDITGEVGA